MTQQIKYRRSVLDPKLPVLYVRKKFTILPGQIIRVLNANHQLVAKARATPFKLKERIEVYSDESRSNLITVCQAKKVVDFNAVLEITHPNGKVIGSLKRGGLKSELGQDTWTIYGPDGDMVAKLEEPNLKFSLIRKWLLPFLPQTYRLTTTNDRTLILKQTYVPLLLHYKAFSEDFVGLIEVLPEKLLYTTLCVIAIIEGRE